MMIGVAVLAATNVNAQKGTSYVYGGVQTTSVKVGKADPSVNSNLMLGAARNITNNWSVGAEVNTVSSKTDRQKISEFQVGPFVRYTVPFNDTFGFWGQLNTHYVSGKAEAGATSVTSNGFNGTITPAFYANMGRNWGLNLIWGSLGYKTVKFEGSDNATNTVTAGFGPTNWGIVLSKGF